MNNFYGLAVTGGAGATDFAFNTDLGKEVNPQATLIQNKSSDGTSTAISFTSAGTGYPIGKALTVVQNASTGTGTGFKGIATIVETTGLLVPGSSIPNTGGFNNAQNTAAAAFDIQNGATNYTYARLTSTGEPITVTSTAVVGTSATGTAATFIVTVAGGNVNKVTVSGVGSGYKVGDIITITKTNLEAARGAGILVRYDLTIGPLTEADVSGGLSTQIEILDGGKGHAANDVLTLSAEGYSTTGTGTITVDAIQAGDAVGTNPMKMYPRGIKTSTGTQAATKTIEFLGLDDVNVIIGGFTAGTVLPYSFKRVVDTGTDAALGEITILY